MKGMSTYTEEIGQEIARRISEGEPLARICRDPEMPNRRTVNRWRKEFPEFDALMLEARDLGADAIADECLEIADDGRNDWMEKLDKDEQPAGWVLNGEHISRSKLRIETRLKLLAKWDPRRYGDKLAIGGASDLPAIRSERDLSEAELLAIAKAAAAQEGADG